MSTTQRPEERSFSIRDDMDTATDLDTAVVLAAAAEPAGGTLDLSDLVHGPKAHASSGRMLFIGWWLLSTARPPTSIVLPTTVAARRVLGRFGLLFAARRRGVRMLLNDSEVSIITALRDGDRDGPTLPGFDWKNYDDFVTDETTEYQEDRPSRLRVITDLEEPARRPSAPNEDGRRYHWVDGLGASTTEGPARTRFNGDVDQVLYEIISNVHEWAEARKAIAACSVTLGGGAQSHNRLHIVVMDDGVGIPERVSRQRAALGRPPWQDDPKVQKISRENGISNYFALLHLIFDEAFGGRLLEPIDHGHGLHSVGFLSHHWTGTVNLFTASSERCSWMRRTGRDEWKFSDVRVRDCKGTALHVTFQAPAGTLEAAGGASLRDPVPVLSQ